MALKDLLKEMDSLKDERQAKALQGFFKTGKGQYGEGDVFLGIKVPILRKTAKKYDLELNELQKLLDSPAHSLNTVDGRGPKHIRFFIKISDGKDGIILEPIAQQFDDQLVDIALRRQFEKGHRRARQEGHVTPMLPFADYAFV